MCFDLHPPKGAPDTWAHFAALELSEQGLNVVAAPVWPKAAAGGS